MHTYYLAASLFFGPCIPGSPRAAFFPTTGSMRDLSRPGTMLLKAILFGAIGLLSAFLLLEQMPSLQNAALLFLCIWAFCRLYYFAFYVIERYIDPEYKFSGLWSALQYVLKRRWGKS